ncbi:MAG TPA: DUF4139 domain-containing protein, partial [Rhodomicrobium sp.]|nr:DUF4139 domain-containing protein [Rhodomicrobium sp.]
KTPLAELFRDLPFDQAALASQPDLLNALVGAEVEIEGSVNATGRVFRVEEEKVQLPNNGGETARHRLTLVTPKGFVQAILEDLTALRFTGAETRAQIDRALTGIAANRAKDQRTLAITLAGEGTRHVGFSYVVAAPVWKTSYRLVAPKDGGKARLQGWGILENLTGGDWKEVDLTLVSGNPVALKQQLYSAFFVDRPEVPVSAALRIVPKKDETQEKAREMAAAAPRGKAATRALRMAPQSPLPAPALAGGPSDFQEELGSPALAAEAEEATTQVLYRFPGKVTLASGSTMMIPFVDLQIPAARTYIYQPETSATRPLAAIRLTNDGDSALPAGLVTSFETGADGAANFAGDAQLPLLSKGATKFITFALDAKTDIRREDRGVKQTRLGKAARGQLTLTVKSRWAIDYEITPPHDEDREVFIEEPRQEGWKPGGDMKDVEETASRLRYRVVASKGKTTKATLTREHTDEETVSLTSLAPDRILATISGLQNETPALKEAVAKLSAVVGDIAKINNRKRELEGERKKIGDDQERIRKNLASVGQSSDLGRRYLETLKMQEDRLAAISGEEKKLDDELTSKTKQAEDIAQALDSEGEMLPRAPR